MYRDNSPYFLFFNQSCVTYSTKPISSIKITIFFSQIDFQIAHQEILRQQENRLREQLDAEKTAALRQIEEERVANERMYTEKMANLEMEKFRYKCSKEMLDQEKQALEQQMKMEPAFEYRPYQSNLSEEIRRIMERPSEECLHQTQLKVNKRTQTHHLQNNYSFLFSFR